MSDLTQGIKPVRAVERTLDILGIFVQTPAALGVGEAARLTRIPKSTAYRLILTLESRGYLVRNPESEKYALGPLLRRVPAQADGAALQALAQQVLDELRDTCGETVGLHLLDGDQRVCIAAAEGVRALRTSGRVGSRAPLYSGASAKAIMAFLPEARWEEIIRVTGLAALTPTTISDPRRLREELIWIRNQGYAVSSGEWDEGITSVAAPVFQEGGTVVASLNLSGPSYRFGEAKIRLLVGALKVAAEEITLRLRTQQADAGGET